jgi:hypothetical protein
MYREACPGWQSDDGSSSVAAMEGTMMHKALEIGDYSGLTEEQRKCVEMVQELFDTLKEELSNDNFKRT